MLDGQPLYDLTVDVAGGFAIYLPVRPGVRCGVVVLAAISLPFILSLKLGQVGPLLPELELHRRLEHRPHGREQLRSQVPQSASSSRTSAQTTSCGSSTQGVRPMARAPALTERMGSAARPLDSISHKRRYGTQPVTPVAPLGRARIHSQASDTWAEGRRSNQAGSADSSFGTSNTQGEA